MSLTAQEIKLVRESWKKLISEYGLEKFGLVVFVRLFTDHPEVIPIFKNHFPVDTQINVENLQNFAMATHATSFSTAIEGIVTLLDSSSKVKNEVDAVAEIHTDKPVDASHFELLGQALLNVLQETLDKKADDDVITAWGKTYKTLSDATREKL